MRIDELRRTRRARGAQGAAGVSVAPRSWMSRRWRIVTVFAIFGPPFGAVAVISSFALAAANDAVFLKGGGISPLTLADATGGAAAFIVLLLAGMLFSYIFGFLQALAAGLLIAFSAPQAGRISYARVVLLTSLVGLLAGLVIILAMGLEIIFAAVLGLTGVAAGLMVRFVFGRVFA